MLRSRRRDAGCSRLSRSLGALSPKALHPRATQVVYLDMALVYGPGGVSDMALVYGPLVQ